MAPIYISEPIKLSFSIVPVDSVSHDVVEIVGSHEPVIVQICLCKHLIKLLIGHVFSEVLCHLFQLNYSYLSVFVHIERGKDLIDLRPAVLVAQLGSS